MNTMLNFMDKIYSNSKALTIIYVVGAILLLIFIILLVVSLKKPSKISKKESKKENTVLETKEESINAEKVATVPTEPVVDETVKNAEDAKVEEVKNEEKDLSKLEPINTDNNVANALNNAEVNLTEKKEEQPVQETVDESKLSASIPNVDDYVDNVVKKTYEKNEQFSSVYVENTNTIKIDKVLDNLNVDKDVKEAIVPEEEKTSDNTENVVNNEVVSEPVKEEVKVEENTTENNNTVNNLDLLKQSLEEKKQEVAETVVNPEDLKAKLANLSKTSEEKQEEPKSEEAMNPEDLLKKLNAMKEK